MERKRRRRQAAVAAMALAALTLAGMASCQKENTDAKTDTEQIHGGNGAIARILEFKEQVEHHSKQPGTWDAAYVSVDEAVWNLEALFNYTYAYPELCYGKTVSADTVLCLPLVSNDSVLMSDLVSFYGTMHTAVSAIYNSVTLPDKQFIILDVEVERRSADAVFVSLGTLQGSVAAPAFNHWTPPYAGPFPAGVSWWYGQNGGNSLGQHIGVIDAADTLTMALNDELVPVAPEGYRYVYTGVTTKETNGIVHHEFSTPLYPQLGPYCEFYKENPVYPDDYWMTWDQMNFHYLGERYLVTEILPHDGAAINPESTLFFIYVEPFDNRTHTIGHRTTAKYGLQLVESDEHGGQENLE